MNPEIERDEESTVRGRLPVAEGELTYETKGRGPPILFLHSVIADGRMWDREFALFSRDHRTIRFDLRGFGLSAPATAPYSHVEDIRSLLSHLRADRTFLVGSSMGGAFAIDFALEHPDQVQGLLLAAPGLSGGVEPPFDPAEQAAFEYDERKSQEIADAWSKGDTAAAIEGLRQLWCAGLEGPARELFLRMVQENRTEVFEGPSLQHATRPTPAHGRLPSLRVPTTVLVGDRDNPSSAVFARRIARSVPGARLLTVPGADHLINLSRPERFDAALRDALEAVG